MAALAQAGCPALFDIAGFVEEIDELRCVVCVSGGADGFGPLLPGPVVPEHGEPFASRRMPLSDERRCPRRELVEGDIDRVEGGIVLAKFKPCVSGRGRWFTGAYE